jgi:hypothetical protein
MILIKIFFALLIIFLIVFDEAEDERTKFYFYNILLTFKNEM